VCLLCVSYELVCFMKILTRLKRLVAPDLGSLQFVKDTFFTKTCCYNSIGGQFIRSTCSIPTSLSAMESPVHQSSPHSPTSMSTKVAVAQMTSTSNTDANFSTIQQLTKQAKQQDCSMIFFPENFNFLGHHFTESLNIAQPLDGAFVQRYRQLARDVGIWMSLGGFQEQGPDPDHLYNTHIIVDSSGGVQATYRKIHLFDVDVPNGPVLMESRFTSPGHGLSVCDKTPVGRIGLTVCYDLRFPEVYQRLVFDHGAEVLLVPSAFTVETGKAHWEVLLRARAIETQTYVIAAAQAGRHNEKRVSYGHSLIVDPWGEVVGRLSNGEETGIAVADIDFERLGQIRKTMPIDIHRGKGLKHLKTN